MKYSALAMLTLASVLNSAAHGAEPTKSLDELLKDRAAVQDVLSTINKTWDATRAEFLKLPATVEFNGRQAKLQQAYQDADKRLKEIDSKIAEIVAKEKK